MFNHMKQISFACLITLALLSPPRLMAEDNLLRLEQVAENVYAIVGPFGNRTPENLGNNANFGFVVTSEGVVLIDPGGSFKGAAAIDAVIRTVTDKPVITVINTGGQDHRWLGNSYFKQRGARIIASAQAVEDQRSRETDQYISLGNLIGDAGLEGTDSVFADETFDEEIRFEIGGVEFELRHVGPAHTPGDSLVWLPRQRIVFTGDVVYIGRMLGVISVSNSRNWISAFEKMQSLQPAAIVPGHGSVTDLERARADTYEYLVFLRETVGGFMESGGDIADTGSLDQSRFERLISFELLKGRNAQQVFQEMEWE